MKKIFLAAIFISIITQTFGQDKVFTSEYNKLLWPINLGYGGGITGDDGQYKRLTLFHGHSIALQTGSNDRSHPNTRLYINASGNIGLGTTRPSEKLHVVGNFQFDSEYNKILFPEKLGFAGGITGDDGQYKRLTLFHGHSIALQTGSNDRSHPNTRLYINASGNIGIGTTNPQSKLSVEGQIRATEIKVLSDISVPDYVFEQDYELRTLSETKKYIKKNKHLPEIPSASEISENGIDIGDMNMRLLKKIEELTLYQIELLERLEKAEHEILQLKNN
ncbi:hypothetical protein [Reichenbachiella versicolor]|uniref:hypothetical protein n=1 Tax=Reichenbachiella versicolor TaxID=1821036 RepID=UPI000D6DDD43|nr:hypothetical protein [Reichenbachiella versicolor]